MRPRVIPCLLLDDGELVKTRKFKSPTYIGDPINTLKLFNDMEVDEAIVLDISASSRAKPHDLELIECLASECFFPLGYGGGVNDIQTMRTIFRLGIEKISINTAALANLNFVKEAVSEFGSQSVVVCLDVEKNFWGKYAVYSHTKKKSMPISIEEYLTTLSSIPIGEVIVNDVTRDGEMAGYDQSLIALVSQYTSVPLICCGGAGELNHLALGIKAGADAVAAGSLFVYQNRERGVLVNYPKQDDLDQLFGTGEFNEK